MSSSGQLNRERGFQYLYTQIRSGEKEGARVHTALFHLAGSRDDCTAQKATCMKEAALQIQLKGEYS